MSQIIRELFACINTGRRPWRLESERAFLSIMLPAVDVVEFLHTSGNASNEVYEYIKPLYMALYLAREIEHMKETRLQDPRRRRRGRQRAQHHLWSGRFLSGSCHAPASRSDCQWHPGRSGQRPDYIGRSGASSRGDSVVDQSPTSCHYPTACHGVYDILFARTVAGSDASYVAIQSSMLK